MVKQQQSTNRAILSLPTHSISPSTAGFYFFSLFPFLLPLQATTTTTSASYHSLGYEVEISTCTSSTGLRPSETYSAAWHFHTDSPCAAYWRTPAKALLIQRHPCHAGEPPPLPHPHPQIATRCHCNGRYAQRLVLMKLPVWPWTSHSILI